MKINNFLTKELSPSLLYADNKLPNSNDKNNNSQDKDYKLIMKDNNFNNNNNVLNNEIDNILLNQNKIYITIKTLQINKIIVKIAIKVII